MARSGQLAGGFQGARPNRSVALRPRGRWAEERGVFGGGKKSRGVGMGDGFGFCEVSRKRQQQITKRVRSLFWGRGTRFADDPQNVLTSRVRLHPLAVNQKAALIPT